jgi:MFS family permease
MAKLLEKQQSSDALRFIILMGVVSLCADAAYEGARSISGAYLGQLGATGTVVGLVAGAGELIGYGLRLLTGYLSDRSKKYWTIVNFGYCLNVGVVPLLALAANWQTAAALMVAERTGKAIRSPARDVLLSHAALRVGGGFGFGLHEALDQIGAVAGPVAVAAAIYWQQGYRGGFAILWVPAVVGLVVLLLSRQIYPNPREFEGKYREIKREGLPRRYWIYLAAVAAIAAGYADFPLIAYHFQKNAIASPSNIPLFYALAMGVDAIAALIFGRMFDRQGISVLMVAATISSLFAPLVFLGNTTLAWLGMALWGIGMGAQESILKAAIAGMVPSDKRGSAFGLFQASYGLAWFVGSAIVGFLYDISISGLVIFSVLAQLIAIPILRTVQKMPVE